ncbi:MAG TPA: MFS transporter [Candidatus Binataceae bacterium]|nr:MFS transporter [Candidatus Binataceae bacterium]
MSGFVAFGGARTTPRHQEVAAAPVSAWAPLTRRIFLALWIAALASNLGTWMQNVGAVWLMTSLSSSPLEIALIQTASSLPIFLLALPGGALADILDRRRLLIFSQAWMLLASGALGILTLLGMTTEWTLLGLSFMLGIGSAVNTPAWQAIVAELVPRDELAAAVTLNGINFNLARAAGPALGGLIVAWFGPGANFLLNAASFFGVMIVLYEWRRQVTPAVLPAERVIGAMRTGLRYVRYAPALRAVMVRTVAFVFGASATWAMLPIIARWQLGLGAAGFGLLLAWFGSGAVIGGAMLSRIQRRFSHDYIMYGATILFSAITIELAFTHDLIVASFVLAIGGAAWVCGFTVLNVAAQLSVPRWVQGRALAVYQVAVQGGLAGASALWGAIGNRWGLQIAMGCGALSLLVGLVTYGWRLACADEIKTDPVELWPHPEVALKIDPYSGPALVTVEYRINPARTEEFIDVMHHQRLTRLRDGAVYWGLFVDTNHPDRFVEHFVSETWVEHLRLHERLIASDVLYEQQAKSFHLGGALPITHFISADAVLSHKAPINSQDDAAGESREDAAQKDLPAKKSAT